MRRSSVPERGAALPSTLKAMLLGALLALIATLGIVAATKAASSSGPEAGSFSRLDHRPMRQNRCATQRADHRRQGSAGSDPYAAWPAQAGQLRARLGDLHR